MVYLNQTFITCKMSIQLYSVLEFSTGYKILQIPFRPQNNIQPANTHAKVWIHSVFFHENISFISAFLFKDEYTILLMNGFHVV